MILYFYCLFNSIYIVGRALGSSTSDSFMSPPITPSSDLGYCSAGVATPPSTLVFRPKWFRFSASSCEPSSPPKLDALDAQVMCAPKEEQQPTTSRLISLQLFIYNRSLSSCHLSTFCHIVLIVWSSVVGCWDQKQTYFQLMLKTFPSVLPPIFCFFITVKINKRGGCGTKEVNVFLINS